MAFITKGKLWLNGAYFGLLYFGWFWWGWEGLGGYIGGKGKDCLEKCTTKVVKLSTFVQLLLFL